MKTNLPLRNFQFFFSLFFLFSTSCVYATALVIIDNRSVEADLDMAGFFVGGDQTAFYDVDFFGFVIGEVDCSYDYCGNGEQVANGFSSSEQESTTAYIDDNFWPLPYAVNGFSGSGRVWATINDPLNELFTGVANAESFYDVTFELLTPHNYTLNGTLGINSVGTAGQHANLDLADISLSYLDSPFSLNGILPAGTYRIYVRAEVFCYENETGHGNFDFNLSLTEIPIIADGDVNLDGLVNAGDVLLAERHVLGTITLTPEQIAHADLEPVGADGDVDLADLLLLTQQVLGL